MAKRSKSVNLGGGVFTTRTGLKKAGTAAHHFSTSPTKGKRYTKKYTTTKKLARAVRGPAGTLKSRSVGGSRMIANSHAWNASARRGRKR